MASENILELQKQSKSSFVFFTAALLFLHNTGLGGCYVYGGLTLYHHTKEETEEESRFFMPLTEDEASSYMSIVPFLNLFGSILAYPALEFFGRKPVLIATNVLQIAGFVIMFFSSSFALLMFGRCLTCFAIGLGVMAPFVLISEITTIKQRAPMSIINTQSISYGILASFLFVYFFPVEYLIFFTAGESALFLVLSFFLPESPHFLIRKGKIEAAERIYKKLRGNLYSGISDEVNEVIELMKKQNGPSENMLSQWNKRTFLQPLAILMFMMFFIALNGVDCPLNFYGPSMFAEFGFTLSPALISCIIPAGQLLGYSFAPLVMSVISKKRQYFLACIIMFLSTCTLALSYYAKLANFTPAVVQQVGLAMGCLGLTFGYGVGMGSVSYAMPGEILSPSDKTIGISIAQCVRMIATTVIIKVYPFLVKSLGYPILFSCHALNFVAAAMFVLMFLPETKDKSLSEIQSYFKSK